MDAMPYATPYDPADDEATAARRKGVNPPPTPPPPQTTGAEGNPFNPQPDHQIDNWSADGRGAAPTGGRFDPSFEPPETQSQVRHIGGGATPTPTPTPAASSPNDLPEWAKPYTARHIDIPKRNWGSMIGGSHTVTGMLGSLASNDPDIQRAQNEQHYEFEKQKMSEQRLHDYQQTQYARNLSGAANPTVAAAGIRAGASTDNANIRAGASRDVAGIRADAATGKMNLNQLSAYIVQNPDQFEDDVVGTAKQTLAKQGQFAPQRQFKPPASPTETRARDHSSWQTARQKFVSALISRDPSADVGAAVSQWDQQNPEPKDRSAAVPAITDAIAKSISGVGAPSAAPQQAAPQARPAQAQQQPRLKPNWRYKINGREVKTDADGNIVQ